MHLHRPDLVRDEIVRSFREGRDARRPAQSAEDALRITFNDLPDGSKAWWPRNITGGRNSFTLKTETGWAEYVFNEGRCCWQLVEAYQGPRRDEAA